MGKKFISAKKSGGADITKFFDKKTTVKETGQVSETKEVEKQTATDKHCSKPLLQKLANGRTQAAPHASSKPKQAGLRNHLFACDVSPVMKQEADDEGLAVVWASSPGWRTMQRRGEAGCSDDQPSSPSSQELKLLQQENEEQQHEVAVLTEMNETSDVRIPQTPAGHTPQRDVAFVPLEPAAQPTSRLQEILDSLDAAHGASITPAPRRPFRAVAQYTNSESWGKHTTMRPPRSLTNSSSASKRPSGLKRKALMELLDEVALIAREQGYTTPEVAMLRPKENKPTPDPSTSDIKQPSFTLPSLNTNRPPRGPLSPLSSAELTPHGVSMAVDDVHHVPTVPIKGGYQTKISKDLGEHSEAGQGRQQLWAPRKEGSLRSASSADEPSTSLPKGPCNGTLMPRAPSWCAMPSTDGAPQNVGPSSSVVFTNRNSAAVDSASVGRLPSDTSRSRTDSRLAVATGCTAHVTEGAPHASHANKQNANTNVLTVDNTCDNETYADETGASSKPTEYNAKYTSPFRTAAAQVLQHLAANIVPPPQQHPNSHLADLIQVFQPKRVKLSLPETAGDMPCRTDDIIAMASAVPNAEDSDIATPPAAAVPHMQVETYGTHPEGGAAAAVSHQPASRHNQPEDPGGGVRRGMHRTGSSVGSCLAGYPDGLQPDMVEPTLEDEHQGNDQGDGLQGGMQVAQGDAGASGSPRHHMNEDDRGKQEGDTVACDKTGATPAGPCMLTDLRREATTCEVSGVACVAEADPAGGTCHVQHQSGSCVAHPQAEHEYLEVPMEIDTVGFPQKEPHSAQGDCTRSVPESHGGGASSGDQTTHVAARPSTTSTTSDTTTVPSDACTSGRAAQHQRTAYKPTRPSNLHLRLDPQSFLPQRGISLDSPLGLPTQPAATSSPELGSTSSATHTSPLHGNGLRTPPISPDTIQSTIQDIEANFAPCSTYRHGMYNKKLGSHKRHGDLTQQHLNEIDHLLQQLQDEDFVKLERTNSSHPYQNVPLHHDGKPSHGQQANVTCWAGPRLHSDGSGVGEKDPGRRNSWVGNQEVVAATPYDVNRTAAVKVMVQAGIQPPSMHGSNVSRPHRVLNRVDSAFVDLQVRNERMGQAPDQIPMWQGDYCNAHHPGPGCADVRMPENSGEAVVLDRPTRPHEEGTSAAVAGHSEFWPPSARSAGAVMQHMRSQAAGLVSFARADLRSRSQGASQQAGASHQRRPTIFSGHTAGANASGSVPPTLWGGVASAAGARGSGAGNVSPTGWGGIGVPASVVGGHQTQAGYAQPVWQQRAEFRHCVVEIQGETATEKLVKVVHEASNKERMVHLLHTWIDTPLAVGDVVNLAGAAVECDGCTHIYVDSEQGMVVLHPDLLVSGTAITSAVKCQRQAWLQEKFAGTGSSDKAVLGTMLHELLQSSIHLHMDGQMSHQVMQDQVDALIQAYTASLYDVGVDESQAKRVLMGHVPSLLSWMEKHVRHDPHPEALVEIQGGGASEKSLICIEEVMDVEEQIWAPSLGLKGVVDLSLRTSFHPPAGTTRRSNSRVPLRSTYVPLEFKSGKDFWTHRAQVALYLLLMSQRYPGAGEMGMLWNVNNPTMSAVPRVPQELASLMQQRNTLASHLARPEGARPPEPVRDERMCSRCLCATECAAWHAAVEGGTAESWGVGREKWNEVGGNMQPAHAQWLARYLRAIDLEETASRLNSPPVWAQNDQAGAAHNQIKGLTFREHKGLVDSRHGQRHLYMFSRNDIAFRDATFTESSIGIGDMVVLSMSGCHYGVARVHVDSISAGHVSILAKRTLPFERLQSTNPEAPWQLDKEETMSTFKTLRTNLTSLATDSDAVPHRLRELIMDMDAPKCRSLLDDEQRQMWEQEALEMGLSGEQSAAVAKVLEGWDYTLLLGMPGTGKTSTIVHLLKALLRRGVRTLIAAYTNSALDNILAKLLEAGVTEFVRLGNHASTHPSIKPYMLGGAYYPHTDTNTIACVAASVNLVGTTALSMSHPLLTGQHFDICIVDEAGQISLPAVLGPLMKADRFVLVGDPHQLPPLCRSEQAAEEGLQCSLFEQLTKAHPQAMVSLTRQWRMAEDIMSLSNELQYNGAMSCASLEVADGKLMLPFSPPDTCPAWMEQVLSPDRRVVWLDTDSINGPESEQGSGAKNSGEAAICVAISCAMVHAGVKQADIAIISPYNSQVRHLRTAATHQGLAQVEVLTVDKSQGRDKQVLVISMAQNNKERNLMADIRRLNVALTRAQVKLIIVGSQAKSASVPNFAKLLDIMRSRQWVMPLPPSALAECRDVTASCQLDRVYTC